MALDIFAPQVSTVSRDMSGKTILVYGTNGVGKTLQGCKLPKPFYLAFENGLNGIAGIPFANINTWSDFKRLNKQLTNPATLDRAREIYQTIIFDTVKTSALMCQDYVATMYDAPSIKTGNGGYGLWSEYETEYWMEINKLTSAGYTVYFIAHDDLKTFQTEDGKEIQKIYPEGDKRSIDPICDLVDIILYLKANGLNDDGTEKLSTAFSRQTLEYHARSRFKYFPPFIKEFTAENLQNAIAYAVEQQEKTEGIKAVSYTDFVDSYTTEKLTFEQLFDMISKQAIWCKENDKIDKYLEVVELYLGRGNKVSEANSKQVQQLEMIYTDLCDFVPSEILG